MSIITDTGMIIVIVLKVRISSIAIVVVVMFTILFQVGSPDVMGTRGPSFI